MLHQLLCLLLLSSSFTAESDGMWIGLSDPNKRGAWEWSDGSPLMFESWFEEEPSNDPLEYCVEMQKHKTEFGWNNRECAYEDGWVCSRKTCGETTTSTANSTTATTTTLTANTNETVIPSLTTNPGFSFTLDTNMIVVISFISLMAATFLGFLAMQGVTRCTRWKRECNAKRGPKTQENEDYGESDEETPEDSIHHENVYYGEGIYQEGASRVRDNNSLYQFASDE